MSNQIYNGAEPISNKADLDSSGKILKNQLPSLDAYSLRTADKRLHSSIVNPDVVSFGNSFAPPSQASQSIVLAPNNVLSPANLALFDTGQTQGMTPQVTAGNNPSNGWVSWPSPWSFQQDHCIRFYTDSKYISMPFYYGIMQGVRCWVDGQPAAINNQLMAGANTAFTIGTFVSLAFNSNKARLIEFRTDNFFYGVSIEATAQVWAPPPLPGPRVLVIGASVTQGSYATGGLGCVQLLGEYLNIPNIAIDGQGGSGFLANGAYYGNGTDGTGSYSNAARRAAHVAWKPDVVIVNEVLNDFNTPFSQTQIQNAMVAEFAYLRTQLPNAKLIQLQSMMSPYFRAAQGGTIPASINTLDTALKGGLLDPYGVKYVQGQLGALTGTGFQGTPVGDGNCDRYITTDGAHPNDAGSQYLAQRLASYLYPALAA